jgi:hypothetical protein
MATARRLNFLEFLKASIADLITLLFSLLHNATATIVLLTPANFYHFQRRKFYFQPLSFTFETFGKKLAETKIVARVNVKKIKAKKIYKRLLNALRYSGNDFLPKFVNNGGFLATAEALLKCYE